MRARTGSAFVSSVPIRRLPPSPVVAAVRADYIEHFGADPEGGGWYHDDDWARISFVLGALDRGGSFLDVGLGAGQFVNAVARTGWFETVAGADPTRFGKYIELEPGIDRHDRSIAELPFGDGAFDVVTCMEVLEHLPPEIFEPGLAELRRVCRGQLLMTVPYEEPEPITPSHTRRFTAADLASVFPSATAVLLHRPRMPWALMEERPRQSRSGPAPASNLRVLALEAAVGTRSLRLPATRRLSTGLERARRTIGRSAAGPVLKRTLRSVRRRLP